MPLRNPTNSCSFCRRYLEGVGEDWGSLCPECADATSAFFDRTGIDDARIEEVIQFVQCMIRRSRWPRRKFRIPTFNGVAYESAVLADLVPEFGKPFVPVLIYRADGVRIVLGASDLSNPEAPDIQIERRPNGWAIFLHPMGESDPSGYVYFVDDGRSFIVPQVGATPSIEVCDWEDALEEVDRTRKNR